MIVIEKELANKIREADVIMVQGHMIWGTNLCNRVIQSGKKTNCKVLRLGGGSTEAETDDFISRVIEIKQTVYDGQNRTNRK